MRLFAQIDGTIDTEDGAALLIPPFDQAANETSTPLPRQSGFAHTYTFSWSDGSEKLNTSTVIGPFESEFVTDQIAEATGDGSTHDISVNFKGSRLKSVFLMSTKAVSISFNNTDDALHIDLVSNVPYQWCVGNGITNPFSFLSNITALKTNNPAAVATANDAIVKIRILYDTAS